MIQFKTLRQYTHKVNGIRFPMTPKAPYLLVYLSENSTLMDDYPNLGLRKVDVRHVIVPITKIPITRISGAERDAIKGNGMIPLSSAQKTPAGKNILYDLSKFLTTIDDTYNPSTYRQRPGALIANMVNKVFESFPSNYQKILIYSVDMNKTVNKYTNRKIFPLLFQLKKEVFKYDHLILSEVGSSSTRHRLLIKSGDYKFTRIQSILKSMKQLGVGEDFEDTEAKENTEKVIKKVSAKIQSKNKKKIGDAVEKFIRKDPETMEKLSNIDGEDLPSSDAKEITTAAILHQTDGDVGRAKRVAKLVPTDKKTQTLKAVDKKYADDLLEPQKTVSTSEDITVKASNVPDRVDNKSPEHLFQKRRVDFDTNLEKDMVNSFKVLQTKDVPLNIKKITISEKPGKAGELEKSDINIATVILEDQNGNRNEVRVQIPKIQPDGTFRVNGRKKCLINQIILCPITFPKPYNSRFESSYSAFRIYSKRTKRESHLEIYLASNKLPLLLILVYSFGFEKIMKSYGLKYEMVTEKPPKGEAYFTKISEESWIIFRDPITELQKELAQSFARHDFSEFKTDKEFGTKLYFNDIIVGMTGRINSTYLIESNLANIVDPVVKQVLINKRLPSDLENIMRYMATKVVEGFKQLRNDISNQRIRNSEIIVHLLQKQVLASYTEYQEKVLSGNKDAILEMSETKVLSEFLNSEIVADMEYANPMEEMATLTRTSPVGKSVGGIPDKGAITLEGRDVHPSMYGNIDPLDTPEGENVGMVQHLTIDAYITSTRGIFNEKPFEEGEDSGLLSTSASLIPFVENDDGARVMFSCNQGRQSVPLKNPTPPIVQSGYESILTSVLSDSFIKKSPCNGKVESVTDEYITLRCTSGERKRTSIAPIHLRSGSGKDTLSVYNTVVKKGQVIKKSQILAEGSCIAQGSIALGRTLCVAFMPYKGYNFEDGIVISDTLVKSESLTSLHGIVEEVLVSEDDRLLSMVEIGQDTKKGEPLIIKTLGEVEQLLGFEDDESSDLYAGQYTKKSPGGKIVDIEVFSNVKGKFAQLDALKEKTNRRYKITPREKFTIGGRTIKGVLIKIKIQQELPIGIGDKLTNRHGAKGIISLVEKEENMPITPWGDRVEIICNPIGVINRMNMGQFYEAYVGLISKHLARNILSLTKPKGISLMKKVLTLLDTSPSNKFSKKFIATFNRMSVTMYNKFLSQLRINDAIPIIIPAFKAPTYKEIIPAMKILGLKEGYKLRLPEYGTSTKTPVSVGYNYFLKLEHIGEEKLHGRSTGPVTGKTGQPTAGKSREGGQRMGELDTYSLISFNCLSILAESFGPLSDDAVTKNEILSDIVQQGNAEYRPAKISPTKDLLNAYFYALMLGNR